MAPASGKPKSPSCRSYDTLGGLHVKLKQQYHISRSPIMYFTVHQFQPLDKSRPGGMRSTGLLDVP